MYVPPHFREQRTAVLHEAIRHAGLALLVGHGASGLVATHVPLLLDAERGPLGTLVGHLARANPQWRDTAGAECLCVFGGADAYVSPSAYATKAEHGRVVPTWNYVAVHAWGPLQVVEDPERLLALVSRLTEHHEAPRATPWAVADAPADYVRAHLRGIVGIELPLTRLEGKWKMSQNRSPADRAGVIADLEARGTPEAAAVAAVMRGLASGGG